MSAPSRTDAELNQAIAAERRDLAGLLSALSPHEWDSPTLCAGWRVRELVAHMTMPFRYSAPRFFGELLRSGGNFNRMADRCARRDARTDAAALASALGDNADYRWKPPGGGLIGALSHDVIHGLDFTVPLRLDRHVPQDRLLIVLQSIKAPKALKHFDVDLTGIELRADDLDWSLGSGTPVSGDAQDLLLLACGRKLPSGHLRGEPAARFTAA
jgi:uncharacterized protein (TIGR03083 family)